jgi:5-methylcytosine-specific restriction endonuclease McrA
MPVRRAPPDHERLDRIVTEARRARGERERGYRERALKLHPWVCGRCARTFDRSTVQQLTVHHKDHNHDHNPPDGSNWELLCVYCHDNEHSRELEAGANPGAAAGGEALPATHRPFANLAALLRTRGRGSS